MTEEEQQQVRARNNERRHQRLVNMTEEEQQQVRARNNERRHQRLVNMTEEEHLQHRNTINQRNQRQHANRLLSSQTDSSLQYQNYLFDANSMTLPDISPHCISLEECMERCKTHINKTVITNDEKGYVDGSKIHQIMVCVVCDISIIGIDMPHWITSTTLKIQEDVLSAQYFYKNGINPILKRQYEIDDPQIRHLLLSPRARRRINDDSFMCCKSCYDILFKMDKVKKPPKYAISNGFAIGHLPESITTNITPLVNNLVAPVRAFNYFISFNSGKEQKITGNFTFFAQNVSENIGALQHTAMVNNNPSIFIVLLGSFTTRQLDKIRTKGSYNVDTFKKVYKFLQENNLHYSNLPSVDDIPIPSVEIVRVSEGEEITNETSEGSGNNSEEIYWKYWFPTVEEPNAGSSTFSNQSEFARAIFEGETPTLFYHPDKILSNATLSQLCPIAFPFGTGDYESRKRFDVSDTECLQHYLKLSLPQFLEGQTVLIIHHMYQRRKSFLSGVAKCNLSNNGNTISDQIGTLSSENLTEAIEKMLNAPQNATTTARDTIEQSDHIKQLLRCIKTACTPIGYTNEAAAEARSKMFALWMTFGAPSLLFTFSPCDECSFKMQLHALGKPDELPSIHNSIEILTRILGIRKSLRVQYPGSCAREFDSLLRIVIKEVIGWEDGKQVQNGIFGKILAFTNGVEEQGRTSLHGHIILWVQDYQNLQRQLFSKDEETRRKAHELLSNYFDKVFSSSFDISSEEVNVAVLHNDHQNVHNINTVHGVSLQCLREMRHRELLKNHRGKILMCDLCNKCWDTEKLVNEVIEDIFPLTQIEEPDFWPQHITFPLAYEQIELLALRYQYDMVDIKPESVHLKRLLTLLVLLFFNTHDWHHRKSCFKKGNECRFHIPKKPCENVTIVYNETLNEEMLSTDNPSSSSTSTWHHIDETITNVCGYEVVSKRDPWDVFVNTNNQIMSKIFGYNNNVCIGNINTLYYCTLYTSKSNQEEETYPYIKALEAVYKRLKRVEENSNEFDLSNRQVGLRNLLSGINAHLASCVVSATMAWYLVTNGSRFNFSHEFKPMLLSQLEDWYHDRSFIRRIRHNKRRRRGTSSTPDRNLSPNGNDRSESWFDSSIESYIFRPENSPQYAFETMCIWEYESLFDVITISPRTFIEEDDPYDLNEQYFKLHYQHPGYQYSCLMKRKAECVPKLYYNSKFPDLAELYVQEGCDISDKVIEMREKYALKALLMFHPFRHQMDLKGSHDTLWDSFIYHRNTVLQDRLGVASGGNNRPILYKHSLSILQNIQDLLNVKKVPKGEEMLQSCTSIITSEHSCNYDINEETEYEEINNDEDTDLLHDEAHIQLLAQYINLLTQESSTFNNPGTQQRLQITYDKEDPAILSITPSQLPSTDQLIRSNGIRNDNNIDDCDLPNIGEQIQNLWRSRPARTIISVISRAVDDDNIQVQNIGQLQNDNRDVHGEIINGIDVALCSMKQFATDNNLDRKQIIAFQTICTSFMLAFLNEESSNVAVQELQQYHQILVEKGASEQLLMCVTGPGGSGKSHVVKCSRRYCKAFCDSVGQPFNFSVFPVTATSNSAASLINGITVHSAALLNTQLVQMEKSVEVDWTVTKALIIDEISMADKSMFPKLDKNLRILTGNRNLIYGGIHIIFFGDFMQLAPVQGIPIYNSFDDILWHGVLNAAVFLDEYNHRFTNDTMWGEILSRIQVGQPTDDDIKKINERILSGALQLPDHVDCSNTRIVYGCYSNKMRNQLSDACFVKHVSSNSPSYDSSAIPLEQILIIKGKIRMNSKDVGPDFHKVIWATCGDDNLIADKSTRVDPCLKLIVGCSLMIITRKEKKRKVVKGMMGTYVGVKWKTGHTAHVEDYYGYKVNCAHIGDVESIILKLHQEEKYVEIYPEIFSVSIKLPGCKSDNVLKGYQVEQFPLNQSLSITGHKLQGMTVDILILAETNSTMNWLYVLLSRVTTLKGLYLMKPLTKNMFKPISSNLKRELEWLRSLESKLMERLQQQL